jgi:hypothetical protein
MIVASVAALLLSLFGAAAVTAPAYAAATCSSYSCTGHDPQTRYPGCKANTTHGSTTASYGGIVVVTAWNYYSVPCNANWAQGQLTPGAVSRGYKMQVQIATDPPNGVHEAMCYPGPSDTGQTIENCTSPLYGGSLPAYTDMVMGTNLTFATVSVFDPSGTTVLVRAKVNL